MVCFNTSFFRSTLGINRLTELTNILMSLSRSLGFLSLYWWTDVVANIVIVRFWWTYLVEVISFLGDLSVCFYRHILW